MFANFCLVRFAPRSTEGARFKSNPQGFTKSGDAVLPSPERRLTSCRTTTTTSIIRNTIHIGRYRIFLFTKKTLTSHNLRNFSTQLPNYLTRKTGKTCLKLSKSLLSQATHVYHPIFLSLVQFTNPRICNLFPPFQRKRSVFETSKG